jgi:hypothetical protein
VKRKERSMKSLVNAVVVLAVMLLAAAALSGVPRLVNYQGILTDSGGLPLDGSYDLTFKIYPDTNAATPYLWKEVHLAAEVDEGLFNVILGSVISIPDSIFADGERYIGVAVDLDPEMTPRMRITSVPWAMHAAVADSALNAGGAGDGHSLDAADGSPVDVVYVDEYGYVGIGIAPSDTYPIYLGGDVGMPYEFSYYTGAYKGLGWNPLTGSVTLGNDITGLEIWAGAASPRISIDKNTGHVGVGTSTPAEPLDVAGTAEMDGFRLTASPTAGYVLTSDATGVGTWQAPGAVADGDWIISGDNMYSSLSGNVGIGDMTPESKLDVAGDVNANGGYKIIGNRVLHMDGTSNISVGQETGEYNASWGCALVGRYAGHSNQGYCNTFVGAYAGTTSTGGANTFVGFDAGNTNTSGSDNTFIGYGAGRDNTTGEWNTFVGFTSGTDNTGGGYNTCLGMNSGRYNIDGSYNVFLGQSAGHSNQGGDRNVAFGTRAGYSNVSGNGNVFIGYRAGYSETGSDNLYIANGQYDSNVLIYGDFAAKEVGLGTVTPGTNLEIYEDVDDFVGLYINNPNTGVASSEGIYFKNEDGSVAGIRLQNSDQMSMFNNRPAGYISWSTAGSQRMVIANDGNVGIGTGSPGSLLHVDGVVQIGSIETIEDVGSNTLGCHANWVSAADGSWNLGSSTNRWAAVWAVDGTINTSDERLKESISDLEYGLGEVMKLRPVSFTWRDRPEAGRKIGLIAQEVEPVISEAVARTEAVMAEGPAGQQAMTKPAENLGIYYSELIPVLINAVQEQQDEIEEQAERIRELEARIAEIENR